MNPKRVKILGAYLLAASSLHMCLYLAMSLAPDKFEWLLYFDPRVGIFFVETFVRQTEQSVPSFFRWLSAMWVFLIGWGLFAGRPMVKAYVVSELLLLLPNVCFFVFIVLTNLSPSHGFSVGELLLPLLVMVIFSFVPLWLAWRCRSTGDAIESLNLS
jgi:hypothetical protein